MARRHPGGPARRPLQDGNPLSTADELWKRTTLQALPSGASVRVPDPETSLIHFLLHLNRDGFRNLLGYVDVLRILQREDLDWDYIDRFVRSEGIQTPVYMAPRAVVTKLEESDLARFEATGVRAQIWRFVWRPGVRLQGQLGVYRYVHRGQTLLPLLTRGRVLEALAWRSSLVFPPRALVDVLHPTTTGPYLWRLIKGRTRHVVRRRRVGRRVRRDEREGRADTAA